MSCRYSLHFWCFDLWYLGAGKQLAVIHVHIWCSSFFVHCINNGWNKEFTNSIIYISWEVIPCSFVQRESHCCSLYFIRDDVQLNNTRWAALIASLHSSFWSEVHLYTFFYCHLYKLSLKVLLLYFIFGVLCHSEYLVGAFHFFQL